MSLNTTYTPAFSPSQLVTTVTTAVILGLLFVTFVFLLFCRFVFETASRSSSAYSSPDNSPADNAMPGLDPLIRDMFPTFLYSAVKRCKKGLECAICLSEVEDKDGLRLLTVCCHVFHQTCIDEWLEKHKTCPICRSNLSNPEKEHNMCPLLMFQVSENGNESDEVALTVHEDECETDEDAGAAHKFPKAHSMGHSVVLVREDKDADKYRLLLTDPVRTEIAKGHRCVRSCTIFREFSTSRAEKPHRSRGDSIP